MDSEKYSKEFENKRLKPIKRKMAVLYGGGIILILIGIFVVGPKLHHYMTHEATDNAFVKGDVVSVAAMVKGKVVKVFIEDNMAVKKGDKLFELDSDEYKITLDQRKEELEAAKSQIARTEAAIRQAGENVTQAQSLLAKADTEDSFAQRERTRYAKLADDALVSKNFYDSVKAKADETKAQKVAAGSAVDIASAQIATLTAEKKTAEYKAKAAEQAVRAAELDLSRTVIYAPSDGRIGQNNVKTGRYVQPGQAVISLVNYDKLWVEGNFKETQMEHIKVGQHVEIKADAYPHAKIEGHVESIQPGTGSAFSLLPAENATGNFVKVVQRVPVRIALDKIDGVSLIPGLSVVPSIKTK